MHGARTTQHARDAAAHRVILQNRLTDCRGRVDANTVDLLGQVPHGIHPRNANSVQATVIKVIARLRRDYRIAHAAD